MFNSPYFFIIPIKVTRNNNDTEDLEKACMMALLQHLGYTYSNIKELYNSVKVKWTPKYNEKYYYITDSLEVKMTYNYGYDYDIMRIGRGNFFKTGADAEKKLNEVKEIMKNND